MGVLFNCLFLLCFHSEGSHRCCIRIHVHNIVMNALSLCYLKICTSAHANTHCVFQHIEINFFFNGSIKLCERLDGKNIIFKKSFKRFILRFFFLCTGPVYVEIYIHMYVDEWSPGTAKIGSKYIKVFIFFSNVTSVRIFNIARHWC